MENELDDLINQIAYKIGYSNPRRYRIRGKFIFNRIPLNGLRVLDVGCGNGALALWSAVNGANYVLGIEPERDGSTEGSFQVFQNVINNYKFGTIIEAGRQEIQDIIGIQKFDIIILYNVINHIDEHAVQLLPNDPGARSTFLEIGNDIKSLLSEDGVLILADCARNNFWGNLGLISPVAPTIEWKKHQDPEVWIDLFSQVGFELFDLRWSPVYPFGKLSENRIFHFFTLSHFVLRLRLKNSKI